METNLGLPAIYCIYLFVTARIGEDLKKRDEKLKFIERLKENNAETYRKKKEQGDVS